jgi:Mg2+ and Co2+ transporter CorA
VAGNAGRRKSNANKTIHHHYYWQQQPNKTEGTGMRDEQKHFTGKYRHTNTQSQHLDEIHDNILSFLLPIPFQWASN